MGERGAAAGCEKASVMDLTETRGKIEDRGEMTDWVGVGSGRWVGVCRVHCWYLLSSTPAPPPPATGGAETTGTLHCYAKPRGSRRERAEVEGSGCEILITPVCL